MDTNITYLLVFAYFTIVFNHYFSSKNPMFLEICCPQGVRPSCPTPSNTTLHPFHLSYWVKPTCKGDSVCHYDYGTISYRFCVALYYILYEYIMSYRCLRGAVNRSARDHLLYFFFSFFSWNPTNIPSTRLYIYCSEIFPNYRPLCNNVLCYYCIR